MTTPDNQPDQGQQSTSQQAHTAQSSPSPNDAPARINYIEAFDDPDLTGYVKKSQDYPDAETRQRSE